MRNDRPTIDRAAAPTNYRVLLLAAAQSYRSEAFMAAAARLGVEVVRAVDVPPSHVGAGQAALGLDFQDPARSVRQVLELARERPLQAVIPTDDQTVILAAHIAQALGLAHNSVAAAETARNKHVMREVLARAGVHTPWFRLCSVDDDARIVAGEVTYPCVVKPTCLSGSRGVIRADDARSFVAAFGRLRHLLSDLRQPEILVEGYVPGQEFALEALLRAGRLTVLAIFDKPDPLEGPFFEETIYVTPSRAPRETQDDIADCVAEAAAALGLREGAVHAEVRVNAEGAWLLEAAGRSIGGLCSQTLRFTHSADVTLEELILRQALGVELDDAGREGGAGGVMMIPIPAAGMFVGVDGLAEARATPGIEAIEITAKPHYAIVPLPEGESYLGFIFARGDSPAEVEAALRRAHAALRFEIEPDLMTMRNRA